MIGENVRDGVQSRRVTSLFTGFTTMYQLSPGSCQRLHDTVSSYDPILNQPHILQILAIKALTSANSVDRYRVILSDGVHFIQAMFALQLNEYVEEKQIQKYSVISIEKSTCSGLQGKYLIIVLSLHVLGSPDNKIGDPKQISPEGTASKPDSTVSFMTPSFGGFANKPLVQQENQAIQNPQLSARDPHANSTYIMEALCSSLNEDVLREIFICCVSDHGNDSKCFILDDFKPSIREYPQFSVSRVCSSWRHIALLTPQLWNNVMIQCLTESNLSTARKYLSNARNLPISITLGPYIVTQDWHSQSPGSTLSYVICLNGVSKT
ncbi:hypothetical protein M378DRAFT_867989 [Amanita muscaria Koide BX008]|uniref:Replication factor-A protein 1 N-terminal domain-containing protein n=1 Tax=Amanita muscaria (strain Koide BX008) TaxID=946122 RepID=A0A0C2WDR1_AMAMK|nr:hypothetical protein M378DRAFT_867989 [Amanita muscaria Koide BX008]